MLISAGAPDAPSDWVDFLLDRAKDARIGIDARMITHENATLLNSKLQAKGSKLIYPPQNLVDLTWRDKPSRSREPIFVQPHDFTGMGARAKLSKLRTWISEQAPSVPSYRKEVDAKPSQMQVATLLTSLSCIGALSVVVYFMWIAHHMNVAWLLNLRGDDIPFNPVFHSYLFVGKDTAILFVEPAKITPAVDEYLSSIEVERREFNDIWTFLRRKEWGEGKVTFEGVFTQSFAHQLSLSGHHRA